MSETSHPPATATVQIDNESVRVTEYRFKPGEATGWHRHEMDYIVVPTEGGRLRMTGPDGATNDAVLERGRSYTRQAGVEHDVLNVDDHEIVFVEVELKPSR